MPVDSPQFATLSPRRALRARKVRAFDERRVVAELAKAVEVEDKTRSEGGGALVQRGFAALLALTLLFLVCFDSSSIGGGIGRGGGGGGGGGGSSRISSSHISSHISSGHIITSSSSSSFSLSVVTSPSPTMQASPAFLPLLSLLPDDYSEQEVESHAESMRILQARAAALLDQASGLIRPVADAVLQQSRELARPGDIWYCDGEVQGHAEGLERLGAALSLVFTHELELARGAQAQLCSIAQALHAAADSQRAAVLVKSGGLRRLIDEAACAARTKAVVVFKGFKFVR